MSEHKFCDVFKQLRKQSGYSQSELAAELGVSQPVISCWERGEHYPSIERLAVIETLFNVPVGELLTKAAYEMAGKTL